MKEMNPREARVYAYIRKTIEEQGYAPSVRDVCTALGYRSTSTVHRYLERLERMGYIEKTDGKSRALRVGGWHGNAPVPGAGAREGHGGDSHPGRGKRGRLCRHAGGTLQRRRAVCPARARGKHDRAGILDGDIVVVERCPSADNGDIVVAMVGDEATVKRFYRENGGYRLQPENPDMEPILCGPGGRRTGAGQSGIGSALSVRGRTK